jgi:very-long-chain enoyl-CoA reductase
VVIASAAKAAAAGAGALAAAVALNPAPALAAASAPSAAAAAAAAAAVTPGLVFLPAWTPLNVALLALAALNLLAGPSEAKGQNTPYGKFSPTPGGGGGASAAAAAAAAAASAAAGTKPPTTILSSRDAMAIIYAGGLLVALLAPLVLPGTFGLPPGLGPGALLSDPAARPCLVALLLALHFAKREAEVFFLHRYSGGIPLPTSLMICTVYTLTSAQYLYFTSLAADAGFYAACADAPAAAAAAAALFAIGQAGNLYHHWLLARLRSGGGGGAGAGAGGGAGKKRAYAVPQGGLFGLVAAPHYLFEIVAWLGLALATQAAVPLVACAGMASYLAGRSAATRRWNVENLPGYPRERRRLVPFVW